MLPKEGLRPQLIPEHEIECLSPSQVKLLYDCMKEDEIIDPVKLDLCDYQAIEPLVHPFSLLREENDPIIEVSPCEALVLQDANKIGNYYNIKPKVMHFNLTRIHDLLSRWDMDPQFEEYFTKLST